MEEQLKQKLKEQSKQIQEAFKKLEDLGILKGQKKFHQLIKEKWVYEEDCISCPAFNKYYNFVDKPDKYKKEVSKLTMDRILKTIDSIMKDNEIMNDNQKITKEIKPTNNWINDYQQSLLFSVNNPNNDKYLGVYHMIYRNIDEIIIGNLLLKKNNNMIEVKEKYDFSESDTEYKNYFYNGMAFFMEPHIIIQNHSNENNLICEFHTIFVKKKESTSSKDHIDFLLGIDLGVDINDNIHCSNVILEKLPHTNDDEKIFNTLKQQVFHIDKYSGQIKQEYFDYLMEIDDVFLKIMHVNSLSKQLQSFREEKDKYRLSK